MANRETAKEPYYLPLGNEVELFESAFHARLPVMLKLPRHSSRNRGAGGARRGSRGAAKLKYVPRPRLALRRHTPLVPRTPIPKQIQIFPSLGIPSDLVYHGHSRTWHDLEFALVYRETAPTLHELMTRLDTHDLVDAIQATTGRDGGPGPWMHWNKLRHLDPPGDLTTLQWWASIKFARSSLLRPLPLTDPTALPFRYAMPDEVLAPLHQVDQQCAGRIGMAEDLISDEQARQRYLVSSLMEEAIRSSQLEGATTSRAQAIGMLRSGREPVDRGERMILNNYIALGFMRGLGDDPLTPEIVLELQRILTDGTLDTPDAAGRLQRPDEQRVAVYDRTTGEVVHRPPPAEQLPERMAALCAFANGDDSVQFMHPVIRAILIHFWLGYDHPFEDGNGRTARALFYWSMRRGGYWLVEYLSISRILRAAPVAYSEAFVLTETDERDTTYFLIYQLDVIVRALADLDSYLKRKTAEIRQVEDLARSGGQYNHRQLALLGDALRTPGRRYTYASHATSHGVTEETARTDLRALQKKGLLRRVRGLRRHTFEAAPGLAGRLQEDRAVA